MDEIVEAAVLIFASPNVTEHVNRRRKLVDAPEGENVLAALLDALEHPQGYAVTESMGELFVVAKGTAKAGRLPLLPGGDRHHGLQRTD